MKNRYAPGRHSLGRSLGVFLIIVALALGAGYAATKYVITPYLLGEYGSGQETPDGSEEKDPAADPSGIVTDQQDIKEPGISEDTGTAAETGGQSGRLTPAIPGETLSLYCIQYGSYSGQEGAKAAVSDLSALNVEAFVLQKDGVYKVISAPYISEQEARKALTDMKAVAGEEIFLTAMEAWMK